MNNKELIERASQVIKGNIKPTVILSQYEAEALLKEITDQNHMIDDFVDQLGNLVPTMNRSLVVAENKLAKLVEALREIAKEMHYPMGIGIDPVPTYAAKIASAALAEIGKDQKVENHG